MKEMIKWKEYAKNHQQVKDKIGDQVQRFLSDLHIHRNRYSDRWNIETIFPRILPVIPLKPRIAEDNNAAVVIVVVVNKDLSKFVKAGGTLCEASRPTLSWFDRKKTLQCNNGAAEAPLIVEETVEGMVNYNGQKARRLGSGGWRYPAS
ncbi:hypothetical protein Scep_024179 [Stephania cephalantha]|uniref:Uncharacterized protein n=1 Tax=Stephania cephalantha TaxID=152367 RepID=A0AAP0F501_9MAGN